MAKNGKGVIAIGEDDWQVRRDLETMIECEKIEKDPKRLAKVKALAKQNLLDMATIAAEGKDES